jgi:hypothetical protein
VERHRAYDVERHRAFSVERHRACYVERHINPLTTAVNSLWRLTDLEPTSAAAHCHSGEPILGDVLM